MGTLARGNAIRLLQRTEKAAVQVLALLVMLALISCGYRLAGERDTVADVRSVHIPPMTNTTAKVGIETFFTNDFILEVNRHGRVAVVGRETAESVLEGVIRDLRTGSAARRSITTTLERKVSVTVDLTLKNRGGKVLWRSRLSDDEAYAVLADKSSTENNLRRALDVISRRMAEKFHQRFTSAF